MPTFIAYNSKKKAFLSILINLAFVLAVAYLLYFEASSTRILVILSVLLVVLCATGCVFMLRYFNDRPQLIISDEGFYSAQTGEIDWSNVSQAFVDSDGDRDFIRLALKDYEKYLRKNESGAIPRLDPASGLETIDIDLSAIDLDADGAERMILDLIKTGKLEVS